MIIVRALARLFSAIIHPLWMPTLGFSLFMIANPWRYGNYDQVQKLIWLSPVFVYTAMLPGLTILMLYAFKFITATDKIKRDERVLPYVATGFFYIVATVFYMRQNEEPFLVAILLGASIAIFLGLIINTLFLKVSMHASGAGGLVAMVMILIPIASTNVTWAFFVALIMAGLVGSSRLAINAHTGREVTLGYFVGYLSQWIAYSIVA